MQSDPSGTLVVQKWMTISLITALQVMQSQVSPTPCSQFLDSFTFSCWMGWTGLSKMRQICWQCAKLHHDLTVTEGLCGFPAKGDNASCIYWHGTPPPGWQQRRPVKRESWMKKKPVSQPHLWRGQWAAPTAEAVVQLCGYVQTSGDLLAAPLFLWQCCQTERSQPLCSYWRTWDTKKLKLNRRRWQHFDKTICAISGLWWCTVKLSLVPNR